MAVLSLKVINKEDQVKCVASGENEVCLVNTHEYQEGDRICLELEKKNVFVWLSVDDALGKSLVYVTDNYSFYIPFGERRISYSPKAFTGNRHYLYARVAREDEIYAYRNLAINVCDQSGESCCYPHAFANVETRGEAVFAARNAIDGVIANLAHGEWPYESWGINRREDAEITVDFGCDCIVDRIVLYTRADFPHDNYWTKAKVTLSNGNSFGINLKKVSTAQVIDIDPVETRSITLSDLIKSEEESPFPALTQLEVYGYVRR